jgi:hypothetical protein
MTDEEWKAWEIQRAGQMNPAPKPSLEARLGWLEADASAQRTAILKLERAVRLICKSLWALLAVSMLLALAVLT